MMKKIFTLLAVTLVCGTTLSAKTIYLNTGGTELWNQAGAVFFAHSWGGAENDVQLTAESGDVFKADIPDSNNSLVFVRMPAGSTTLDWDAKWNQTGDLAIPDGMNCYTITGWGDQDGEWSVYGSGETIDPGYSGSVPAQCPDVMLQAFYWNSTSGSTGAGGGNGYGRTKWIDHLNGNNGSSAEEIGQWFVFQI